MPTDLRQLLGRIESATGPDRALDAEIHVATRLHDRADWLFFDGAGAAVRWKDAYRGIGHIDLDNIRCLTAKTDDAITMMGLEFPGSGITISKSSDPRDPTLWSAEISVLLTRQFHRGVGTTPALAILAAMLKALIGKATKP